MCQALLYLRCLDVIEENDNEIIKKHNIQNNNTFLA